MSLTAEQQAEHWLTKGGPEPGSEGADEYYANLATESEPAQESAEPDASVAAEVVSDVEVPADEEAREALAESQPEETAEEAVRRVLRYKYNREEQEIDLDRLASDEAYQAEVREYIEKGRGLEQTNKRVEQERLAAQQQMAQWLQAKGYSFTQKPDGEWDIIPPQTATAAAPAPTEDPATDFAELERRAKEGDPEAIVEMIRAAKSTAENSKAAALKEFEERLARQRAERQQTEEYQRQAQLVRDQIEETIKRRSASFDASTNKDMWLANVRRDAFEAAKVQGATMHDVIARVEAYANALDAERAETLKRHNVSAKPARTAPPVPGGGPPGPKPDELPDYDDPNFMEFLTQRLRESVGQ